MSTRVDLSQYKSFLPAALLTVSILFVFLVLWIFSSVTIPFAAAIIVAYLFSPIVDWLERYHVARFLGAFLVLAIILGVVVALVFWVVPLIINELRRFIDAIPTLSGELGSIRGDLAELFPLVSWDGLLDDAVRWLEDLAKHLLASLPNIVSGLVMIIYNAVIIPFLLFFFLKDGRTMIRRLLDRVPNKYFEMSVNLVHKIDIGLGRFLRGLLIENSIIAFLAITGLTLIAMPSAFVLGLVIGIFNVIPYMGPTIGFIIAGVLTVINPTVTPPFLAVMAVVAVVQLSDNMLVYPLAIGKSVHMHPVLVIGALLIGGFLLGFFGMILAVPIATSLALIYKTFAQARREYGVGRIAL